MTHFTPEEKEGGSDMSDEVNVLTEADIRWIAQKGVRQEFLNRICADIEALRENITKYATIRTTANTLLIARLHILLTALDASLKE